MTFKVKLFTIIAIFFFAIVCIVWYAINKNIDEISITNFDECAAAGNAILESYPPQCRTADGRSFTQYIGNELEKTDLVRIDTPRPNQAISSPLDITGQARGIWFFEASFPVELRDGNGAIIAQHFAQAAGDWMTEDFVVFSSQLTFTKPNTPNGTLILRKDNPSGLPEHDDELVVPIKFE